jgi:hypothetical protein
MRLSKYDLDIAVEKKIITEQQAEALITLSRSKLILINVLYFLGALLVIAALTTSLVQSWDSLGGGAIFLLALVHAAVFVAVGAKLNRKPEHYVVSGLFYTMAVCLTPLGIYGAQRYFGWWPVGDPGVYTDFHSWIKGGWFLMEIGTIVSGLLALRCVSFPFLTFPIAFSLWYMSMDLTPILFGESAFYVNRLWVSLWFGLSMMIVSYAVDRRTKADFAFWGYLFGMIAFWGGLSVLDVYSWSNEGGIRIGAHFAHFIRFVIGLGSIWIGVKLRRNIFFIFGAIGFFGYAFYLHTAFFMGNLWFPFILTGVGLGIIYLGYLLHNSKKLDKS